MNVTEVKEKGNKIIEYAGRVMIGKEETLKLLLTALLSDGHVLLEDVPGTGKTKLARTLAASLDGDFSRIQFTPDLLPSDITGMNVYNRKTGEFELHRGPAFTNILLADEINRATPRTQAGLLECMEERQVTIDGVSHRLSGTFFVIATQNPVETAGTFPLPEAQMDRFMLKLSMGLPGVEEEMAILHRFGKEDPLQTLANAVTREELSEMKEAVKQVFVHEEMEKYMAEIAAATRQKDKVVMGVSPRGTLALMRGVKAYAALAGREYTIPDDVKALAVPVLAHRLVLSYGYQKGMQAEELIKEILGRIPAPTEQFDLMKG